MTARIPAARLRPLCGNRSADEARRSSLYPVTRRYIGERVLAELLNDPEAAGIVADSAGWELRHIAAEKRSLTIAQKGWAIIAAAVLAWAFAVALAYVLLVGLMLVMPA